jgi:hypothetical protein
MAEKKYLVDIDVDGDVKADSFIKDGGTASEFLKADGSVDTTVYNSGASIFTVATELAQLALSTVKGDIVVRTDESKTYMDNGTPPGGTELITYPNFSSVITPWNYGAWSSATPTTDGTTVTIEVDSVGYPKILQEITTVVGNDYKVRFSVNTDSHDFECVAKSSTFAVLQSSGVKNNSTMTNYDFLFTATTVATIIELALGGQSGTAGGGISVGDTVTMQKCSVKDDDGMAKFTYFATI